MDVTNVPEGAIDCPCGPSCACDGSCHCCEAGACTCGQGHACGDPACSVCN